MKAPIPSISEGRHAVRKKETVKDTARVLGRMFDGIQFRGFAHSTVEGLAAHAGVPVWNGLTDSFHPTQTLADLLTMKENFGDVKGRRGHTPATDATTSPTRCWSCPPSLAWIYASWSQGVVPRRELVEIVRIAATRAETSR